MKTSGDNRLIASSIAQVGALASALLASVCCWLPLLLIAFGVSGGALASRFTAMRPVLLPITFLLLALAFYFTYRKPKAVTRGDDDAGKVRDGEACCSVTQKGTADASHRTKRFTFGKFNKVMLWVVMVFALGLSFFPNYMGAILAAGSTRAVPNGTNVIVVAIEGMTCEACTTEVRNAIAGVPGVTNVEVSFEHKEARVAITKGTQIPKEAILNAINKAGYKGRFRNGGK